MKHSNFVLFFALFLHSCSNDREILRNSSNQFVLNTENFEYESLEKLYVLAGDSNYGEKEDIKLSKGFRFLFDLPYVNSKLVEEMRKKYPVDAWVFRLKKISPGSPRILGSFYTPFYDRERKKVIPAQKSVVEVLYAAYHGSTDFEKLECPLYDHRYLIKKIKTSRFQNAGYKVSLGDRLPQSASRSIEKVLFSRNKLNGGMRLEGSYSLEIAFYDSSSRMIYSNFSPYPLKIDLDFESKVAMRGCATPSKVPRSDQDKKIENFKFGR